MFCMISQNLPKPQLGSALCSTSRGPSDSSARRYGSGGEKESSLLEKRLLCRSGVWKGGVCGMVWPRGRRVTAGSWLLMSPHHPRHHTAAQTPPSSYHQTNPAGSASCAKIISQGLRKVDWKQSVWMSDWVYFVLEIPATQAVDLVVWTSLWMMILIFAFSYQATHHKHHHFNCHHCIATREYYILHSQVLAKNIAIYAFFK